MSDFNTLMYKRQCQYERLKRIYNLATDAEADVTKLEVFKASFRTTEISYQLCDKIHNDVIELIAKDATKTEAIVKQDIAREKDDMQKVDKIYWTILEKHAKLCGSSSSSNNSGSSSSSFKLPPLPLVTFNGKFSEWNGFKDLFNSRVHYNKDLSSIEKYHHLLGCLGGEPLNLVKGLPPSGLNYEIIYKQLCDRYDNHRILATTHWHAILNLPVSISDNSTALYNLINTMNENLSALNSLGLNTSEWSFILFDFVFKKLPKHLCTKYESTVEDSSAVPNFDDLKKFLINHCKGLESVEVAASKRPLEKSNVVSNSSSNSKFNPNFNKHSFVVNSGNPNKCLLCKSNHNITQCQEFLEHSPAKRYDVVKELHLCLNCLKSTHTVRNCSARNSCKNCRLKHHSMLHFENSTASSSSSGTHSMEHIAGSNNRASSAEEKLSLSATGTSSALLSTVLVKVKDSRGSFQTVRCLLDSGSMTSFITQKCVNKLGLHTKNEFISVTGIKADSPIVSNGLAQCAIKPYSKDSPTIAVEAHILPQLVSSVPTDPLESSKWVHLSNLQLADPFYQRSSSLEMILGVDIFSQVVKPGKVSGGEGEPIALDTEFGWVVMGKMSGSLSPKISLLTIMEPFDLKNFWETEQVPEKNHVPPEDILCEQKFVESVSRNAEGRYIVELPFQETKPISLGESRSMALKRLYSLERKFAKDQELKAAYIKVIQEYLDNGYLEKPPDGAKNIPSYYLPHHAVWRPESPFTPLRVVFDASAKSSNGNSLNDLLLAGPKLQADIVSLLLLFRLYKIVVSGDIRKMFLQILMVEKHRTYQRILWRFHPDDPVEEFWLTRVTFGLSCSPFLAMRTILQLVKDEGQAFPLAAQVLRHSSYVDDALGGEDSLENAQALQLQLVELLAKGKFEMRKWASNCPRILSDLPADQCQTITFDSEEDSVLKILGLHWKPAADCFAFSTSSKDSIPTKRSILSDIAKIWDPLGFLTPITFFAKHLIQLLWALGTQWDETPPDEVCSKWLQFKSELPLLSSIKISRFLDIKHSNVQLELHGFCDSSEKGYGCCIYLRAIHFDGSIAVYLLCGRSKVATLKKMSLPRLELCGMVLLSKTFKFVLKTFKTKLFFTEIVAWSDSTIALSWIKSPPHKWKTFVANRVSFIQDIIAPERWKHVSSAHNSADVASRGVLPQELLSQSLWWKGPPWLSLPQIEWPISSFNSPLNLVEMEASKPVKLALLVVEDNLLESLFKRFSSMRTIQGIVAFSLRFISRCRKQATQSGALTEVELYNATIKLAKVVQKSVFHNEIATIERNKLCEKQFRKLSPFLDEKGILRVGGRLTHSQLSFDSKFPVLLPRDHVFTDLIIFSFHKKYLHPGPQTLQYLIGQQFWIIGAKKAISRCLNKCFRCFRVNPKPLIPLMGNLPSHRVSQFKAFTVSGVDLGGPYKVSMGRYRGAKTLKSYICVFICFATKAIHTELVSSLSSEAFIGAFRRLVARRGRVTDIHSDCGTNFVGADRQFMELLNGACDQLAIKWHFNPASAPHMGGLWEAAIRSVKSIISKVIGEQTLTFEEMTTLLAQVDSVLNSRPLMAQSSDPNDLNVLTPNHFLTLEPVSAPPDEDLNDVPLSRLSRWQLIQSFHQSIWRRWHQEYLQTLQQRQKWLKPCNPLKEGALVVIKQDNLPPGKWNLGRILELHLGTDQVARVATVRTGQGTVKRPLVKLCPLPSQ